MGHLVNGGGGGVGDGSRKIIFENGDCLDGPVLKFKKRRISAIREFPPGCGWNALPINGRSKENGGVVGSVKISDKTEDAVVEESNSAVRDFPPGCGPNALPINVKSKENVRVVGSVVNGGIELMTSDGGALPHLPKPLVHETTMRVENFVQVEAPEPMVVDNLPTQLPVESVIIENQVRSEVLDHIEAQPSITDDFEEETLLRKFPPRRKVSAIRDFPPGCGRGAAPVNTKEGNESVDAIKDKDSGGKKFSGVNANSKQVEDRVVRDILKSKTIEKQEVGDGDQGKSEVGLKKEAAQQVYVRGASKAKQEHMEKSGSKLLLEQGLSPWDSMLSKKIDRGSESSGDKSAMGSVKLSKDMNHKRTSLGKSINNSRDIDRSQEKPNVGLRSIEDREIVQSLMAKQKCPWVEGKKSLKPAIGAHSPVVKGKKTAQSPVEKSKKTFKSPSDIQSQVENEKKAFKSASGSQPNIVEHDALQSYNDREIVQSLMAAPKCPWKNGKKPFKSPSLQAKKFVAR